MKKLMFAFFAATLMAVSVDAQTDTVTNRDLEKYQAERLKAEADMRENYKRLGFPSPEELKLRNEESAKATAELSAKLRVERLERERIEAERRAQSQPAPIQIVQTGGGQEFYWHNGHWRVPRYTRRVHGQTGYFAGGAFWPTGNRTRPRPLFVVARPRK